MPAPPHLPAWLREEDVDFYTAEFTRTGFRGGLNWYRNLDRTWELMAAWQGAPVTVPALFVAGERDPVIARRRSDLPRLRESVPALRQSPHPPRLRALDPARAPGRGQCRAPRFPPRPRRIPDVTSGSTAEPLPDARPP